MRLLKLITAASVLMVATQSFASNATCNHSNPSGIRSNTNPKIKVKDKTQSQSTVRQGTT